MTERPLNELQAEMRASETLWGEQDRDRECIEQDRLRRAVAAVLRHAPSPREMKRAWKAWETNE